MFQTHEQGFGGLLFQAAEAERQLSTQVHSLQDDFREKSVSTSQHLTRLEALQAEVSGRLQLVWKKPRAGCLLTRPLSSSSSSCLRPPSLSDGAARARSKFSLRQPGCMPSVTETRIALVFSPSLLFGPIKLLLHRVRESPSYIYR